MSTVVRPQCVRRPYGATTHTSLSSSDADATRAWCTDVLGWSFQPPLRTPEGLFHLCAGVDRAGGSIRQARPGESPSSTPMVLVADTHETFDRAIAAGADPINPPLNVMDGACTALVRAPGGIVIGFSGPTD